ncbi:putative hydrolase [Streptomyces albus]|uniref:Putative hydrolase n=1 Tax=Streptomyces albus (strain ATCC 21838 / DSM 41398 / FERM P-419 / JCM 4703 / NBRC 107858) TaxID=1081613 RepID=A0A0B5F3S7_STRA4|nr:putative hydrolase [Streptomyces albus]AOU79870.1 putative hydrolase [Streptomyces albus]AYN35593.1 putative hydrolase [Streptomyces albus]
MNHSPGGGWERHGELEPVRTQNFCIRRDEVTRPDGSRSVYEYQEIGHGAAVVAQRADGKIALVRVWHYLHGDTLNLPGGTIGCGEAPEQAALRELEEETGFSARQLAPLTVTRLLNRSTVRLHLFAATDLTPGERKLSSNETGMTLEWWDLPDAVEAATDGSLTMAGGALGVLLFAEHARSARRTKPLEAGPQGDD